MKTTCYFNKYSDVFEKKIVLQNQTNFLNKWPPVILKKNAVLI